MKSISHFALGRVRGTVGLLIALSALISIHELQAGSPRRTARAFSGPMMAAIEAVEQKVTPDDAAANSFFGSAVALHGRHALIGADGQESFQGVAYIFNDSGAGWQQGQKLEPSDGLPGDEFGYRVALAADTLVVTAFSATVNGVAAQGSAYVFTRSGDTWTESQKLTASDGGLFDNFGASVALYGDTLVIGANGATVGQNAAQGAAYVFSRSNGSWTETAKLIADDGAAFDNFGLSVALQGSTILVGSPRAFAGGLPFQGAVYVYTESGGSWTQSQTLTASDAATNDSFGQSVALAHGTALVGAYNAAVNGHGGQGAAYVFTQAGDSFTESQKLTANDGAAGDNFGNAVDLRGPVALIGADISTVNGHTSAGKAYLFEKTGGIWSQGETLTASDAMTDNFFGAALALGEGTALIGTPAATVDGNSFQGAVYFYDLSGAQSK